MGNSTFTNFRNCGGKWAVEIGFLRSTDIPKQTIWLPVAASLDASFATSFI